MVTLFGVCVLALLIVSAGGQEDWSIVFLILSAMFGVISPAYVL